MKEYTSQLVKIISYAFLSFPVSYLIFSAIVFDIPFSAAAEILLSPFYYFVCFWAVLTGYGLLQMHRWVWVVFWITNILIFGSSISVLVKHGETHHSGLAFLLFLILMGIMIFHVAKEIYVPHFLPRIRWWESGGGYQFSLPVEIKGESGLFQGQILDLAISGCFIKITDSPSVHQDVDLKFDIFGQMMECPGTVVWKAQSSVTTPVGVGVKFRRMDKAKRRRLRIAGKRMRSITNFYYKKKDFQDQKSLLNALEILNREKS